LSKVGFLLLVIKKEVGDELLDSALEFLASSNSAIFFLSSIVSILS
jgi:hypothetical protein